MELLFLVFRIEICIFCLTLNIGNTILYRRSNSIQRSNPLRHAERLRMRAARRAVCVSRYVKLNWIVELNWIAALSGTVELKRIVGSEFNRQSNIEIYNSYTNTCIHVFFYISTWIWMDIYVYIINISCFYLYIRFNA